MVLAEEGEVGEVGGSAVGPVPSMVGCRLSLHRFIAVVPSTVQRMSIAPSGGPVAAGGMLAVPVAGVQRSTHGGGDGPGGPADVERFGAGSKTMRLMVQSQA